MNRSMRAVLGVAAAATLALAGCTSEVNQVQEEPFPTGPVEISLAGWSFASTPEFQTLADGFHALHPNVTVKLVEYDAAQYDTLLAADLAASKAPDVYILKNLKNFYTYQSNGQLKDVSDIAAKLPAETGGLDNYKVNGKAYAVPYRQDSWVLYYNKDLFDKAGVKYPDGTWTWDDYVATAKELTTKLSPNAKGTYEHSWQSTVQGFALAQTPGAQIDSGDFSWAKPYYQRALDLQNSGAQETLGSITTNKLGYQAQFGTQKAAMLPMGTWFVAKLLAGQAKGDYPNFSWGIAPAPQFDKSTTGTNNTPVTFGDPTGLGLNAAISDNTTFTVAKEFIRYAAGVEGGKALAGIGITPANTTDEVASIYFAKGAPTDDLSKFAWGKHKTLPENPVTKYTTQIQNILGGMHTAILTNSKSVDEAIAEAQNKAKNEVLNQ